MALLAGGPLLVGVLGCLLGGYLTDRHVRRTGDRKWGRRLYGVIGFSGAALCYAVAIYGAVNKNMWLFAAGVALSGFCNDLTMGASWAVCQDIGRRYSAIVSGFMNMMGNLLGGVTTLIVTGEIMKSTVAARIEAATAAGTNLDEARLAGEIDGYMINLTLYALAYVVGIFFWLKIDATKPIIAEDESTSESGVAIAPTSENRH
jgi:ACS family glucarate transporter-like MFS transporter